MNDGWVEDPQYRGAPFITECNGCGLPCADDGFVSELDEDLWFCREECRNKWEEENKHDYE